jgi:hypothetical protein
MSMDEYPERRPIWVRTKDPMYEEKLCHFLTYHYGDRMEVHPFEDDTEGMRPGVHSLLLTDCPQEAGEAFERVIPLTFGEQPGCINLYQSGHRIAEQILRCGSASEEALSLRIGALLRTDGFAEGTLSETGFLKENPPGTGFLPEKSAEPKEGTLLSVFSPIGGCGKTTLAMALAEGLAEAQRGSVLYLNMEGASAWSLFYRNETGYNLSDFLYRLLLNGEAEAENEAQLERMVTHQETGVFFIQPCTSFDDLNLLSPMEVEKLLRLLRRRFDWIVCDMNTAFHSVNRLWIQASRRCFLLANAEKEASVKIRDFLESLDIYEGLSTSFREKTVFLRRGGRGERGATADVLLPECRDLLYQRDHLWHLNRDSNYYQKIREIIGTMIPRAGGSPDAISHSLINPWKQEERPRVRSIIQGVSVL